MACSHEERRLVKCKQQQKWELKPVQCSCLPVILTVSTLCCSWSKAVNQLWMMFCRCPLSSHSTSTCSARSLRHHRYSRTLPRSTSNTNICCSNSSLISIACFLLVMQGMRFRIVCMTPLSYIAGCTSTSTLTTSATKLQHFWVTVWVSFVDK